MTTSGLLSRREAAAYLGIGLTTLDKLMTRRAIRCLRPTKKKVVFTVPDLNAYLNRTANIQTTAL